MAWQKTKILLICDEVDVKGNKVTDRYVVNKSKGTGKVATPGKKLVLKKYSKTLKRHAIFKETKYK